MEFWFAYPAVLLHMLAAIAWAGGVFFFEFVVNPGVSTLPDEQQRTVWLSLVHRLDVYLSRLGAATIVLGAVSGIALVRYQEALGLQSRWGFAIALAAVLAIAAFACGVYSGSIYKRVLLRDGYWTGGPELAAERDGLLSVARRLDRAELLLLPVVIALMALARFS